MSKRIVTSIAAALVVLLATCTQAQELLLQATKSSYRAGEAVVVRTLVTNPLGAKLVPYLKRHFWLVPYSEPMDGDLSLAMQVAAPDGTLLKPTTRSIIVVRMRTDPWVFQALLPGEVFGSEIALTGAGLEYKMATPGTYRVTATLSAASPRKWFDEWRRKNPRGPDPDFKRDDLFEGPVFSAPLEVVILE